MTAKQAGLAFPDLAEELPEQDVAWALRDRLCVERDRLQSAA